MYNKYIGEQFGLTTRILATCKIFAKLFLHLELCVHSVYKAKRF